MKTAVAIYLPALWVLSQPALSHAELPRKPKAAILKAEVIVRFVSSNESYSPDENPRLTILMSPNGGLRSLDSFPLRGNLSGLFYWAEEDKRLGRPVYLIVRVLSEKDTPRRTLLGTVDRIRSFVPPGTRAVIVVQMEGLKGEKRYPAFAK